VLKKAVRAQSVGQLFSAGWNQVRERAMREERSLHDTPEGVPRQRNGKQGERKREKASAYGEPFRDQMATRITLLSDAEDKTPSFFD
jgi:hypothetical protein